ncbi:MAG: 5'/3'-nucleotidase SurE [Armatimonadota bacterium]|nr:5'/3'-nucleotidase SurE [Armatimonadota bacterium]
MANILITNDDGVYSDGLLALYDALAELGDVIVVAPDRPRSASGHSITLHKPLRMDKVRLANGETAYATNGTPSDCVSLAALDLAKDKLDLVVSGINRGPNLGYDLTYSGTVSAAMEAAVYDINSFAISVTSYDEDLDYSLAARFSKYLAEILLRNELPRSVLLNVNVPDVPIDKLAGIEVTRQGKRHYDGRVEKRTDPMGRTYYWLGGDLPVDVLADGTDVKAIAEDKISITPVHLDLTADSMLQPLKDWDITSFSPFSE